VAESGGTEVDPLRNAVDRLIAFCKGRSRVTLADARAIVSGEALVNDWAIVNAVEQGALAEALNQLRLQLDDGRAPHQVFGMLGWWVREKLPQNPRARIGVTQAVEGLCNQPALNSASESRMVLRALHHHPLRRRRHQAVLTGSRLSLQQNSRPVPGHARGGGRTSARPWPDPSGRAHACDDPRDRRHGD
jgi:hypothetical protein